MTTSPLSFHRVTPEDFPRMAQLSVLAYPHGDDTVTSRVERYQERWKRWDAEVWRLERERRHVGQYTTIHYTGWLGGVAAPVAGLAGIAVAPEARRQGVARAIVLHHLERARAAGTPWSMLYPFAPDFYARYGWAPAARRVRWRFPPSALPLYPERTLARRLDGSDAGDLALVQAAYERHCARTSGSLSRTAEQYRLTGAGGRTFLVGVPDPAGDGLSGFLCAHIAAAKPRPQVLTVSDLVALDGRALRALLGFVAAQADQAHFVELDTPVDDPLGELLVMPQPNVEEATFPDEHQPTGQVFNGLMARVVDLAGALTARGYPGAADGSVAFAATDEQVAANQAPVTLTVADHRPTVTSGAAAAGTPLLRGNILDISRLLVGAMRLPAAIRLARVTVENADESTVSALDRLLALPPPYPHPIF